MSKNASDSGKQGCKLPGSCLKAFQFSVKAVLKGSRIYGKKSRKKVKEKKKRQNPQTNFSISFYLTNVRYAQTVLWRFIYVSSVKRLHTSKNAGCQWKISTNFFHFIKSPHHRRGHCLTRVTESEMGLRLLCRILINDINGLSLGCWKPLAKKDQALEHH